MASCVVAGSTPLELLDLKGAPTNPFAQTNAKAHVFVFVSNTCPIANRYAPELRRLERKFADKGVVFWLVHADADETPQAIAEHTREYGYRCGVLRDPGHALVKLAKARVTPEAALFLPNGGLLYHGRIDDRYQDFGQARPAATQHDLEAAITALLAGKPIAAAETKAIGCYIPDLR